MAMADGRAWECTDCYSFHCFWCGRALRMSHSRGKEKAMTRDHWPATSNLQGGQRSRVVPACYHCNNTRGNDDSWMPFHARMEALEEARTAREVKD